MALETEDLERIAEVFGKTLRRTTTRHLAPKNGAAKWWAIGVVVAALGGLVTLGAIGDWFVFTEAEASDFKANNEAAHVEIRTTISDNAHEQQLRDQNMAHNIELIAEKLRVPKAEIKRAPVP